MTRFEEYLIRLKIGFRKIIGHENELRLVQAIHESYKLFKDEPDLTDEEKSELADELRELVKENHDGKMEDTSRD